MRKTILKVELLRIVRARTVRENDPQTESRVITALITQPTQNSKQVKISVNIELKTYHLISDRSAPRIPLAI